VFLSTTAINDRHASQRNGFRSTARLHQKRSISSRFAWIMDYHVWAQCWRLITSSILKPKSITELKEALQVIWDSLSQEPIDKAVKSFTLW